MKQLNRFLMDKPIHVISARSVCNQTSPTCPEWWKLLVFMQLFKEELRRRSFGHFISFGDSECEREAVMNITDDISTPRSNICVKSIKFCRTPTLRVLCLQLQFLLWCHDFIFAYHGNLDCCLEHIGKNSTVPCSPKDGTLLPNSHAGTIKSVESSSATSSDGDTSQTYTSLPIVRKNLQLLGITNLQRLLLYPVHLGTMYPSKLF
uniref:Uncharacterized protein n=1 Tax=Lygus hesperus TaxID=30085 RepID=A0A146L0A7_LYGHE